MDEYGPELPPGYVKPEEEDSSDSSRNERSPEAHTNLNFIGPQKPNFLPKTKSLEESDSTLFNKNPIGPRLPQNLVSKVEKNSSEEDDSYGPMPSEENFEKEHKDLKKAEIERRARNMKDKLDNKNKPAIDVVKREEWMTVPDTTRKNQLGALSRSLAPEESRKEKHSRNHHHSHKDKRTSEELKKYNKSKRSESLLEMHKKSKKRKEDNKPTKEERKAFDREEMAVKQFSKDQVNTVIDKAKFLNSRFSAGSNKYL